MSGMKMQSQNKLIRYQCEYNEILEQIQMLQNQLPAIQSQLISLKSYLGSNEKDRRARTEYSKLMQRYNSIVSTVRRSQMRLQTLQRQIMNESQKLAVQGQRAMNKSNKGSTYYGRYTY